MLFSKYKTKAFVRDRHTDTDRNTERLSYTQDRQTDTHRRTCRGQIHKTAFGRHRLRLILRRQRTQGAQSREFRSGLG